jgi:ubiquinone/menaquinone biosynthesis C-methylase UbiE
LDLLSGTGFSVRPGLALDFGCGLGRLTSPLADAFGSAVGVDVSLGMVEMARKLHSGKPNLRFVHNDQLDLSIFAPNTFDFVYSLITLQHMPQDLAKGYLAEMVRVCRPSSFILVQIVTTRHQRASWFWPPTLAKLAWRAFNRRMALAPVLEMFPMPESDARRAMVGAGAEIIAVLPDGAAGSSFESRLIVARAKNCP